MAKGQSSSATLTLMSIKFFRSQARFRSWLERNYAAVDELWVGFFKKDSGKPSISYKEAVDEALCFGWIDGVRKSIDGVSYTVRFTPRRPRSTWSRINIDRAKELKSLGRMTPTGWQVFRGGTAIERGCILSRILRGNLIMHSQNTFGCVTAPGSFFSNNRRAIDALRSSG